MNVALVASTGAFPPDLPVSPFLVRANQRNVVSAMGAAIRQAGDYGTADHEVGAYLAGSFVAAKPDLIFNLAPGLHGNYSQAYVPMVAEFLGIPCTGSDSLTTSLCQDKMSAKDVIHRLRIPTPSGRLVRSMDDAQDLTSMSLPVMVKPNNVDGCAVFERSICRAFSDMVLLCEELFTNGVSTILVEDLIVGREFVVPVIGNRTPHVMPMVEYDWESAGALKVFGEETVTALNADRLRDFFHCPVRKFLQPKLKYSMEEMAIRAYKALGCRDWATVGFILGRDQIPYLIEVDTIPDLNSYGSFESPYMQAVIADGGSLKVVADLLLKETSERSSALFEDDEAKEEVAE
jgi:D-alanine-D-alanine ligase